MLRSKKSATWDDFRGSQKKNTRLLCLDWRSFMLVKKIVIFS